MAWDQKGKMQQQPISVDEAKGKLKEVVRKIEEVGEIIDLSEDEKEKLRGKLIREALLLIKERRLRI